ncbi:hypothetical protein KBC99_01980 [Candidatus Saccharibacteria bacterium]|nr:hypothetical protein [Candidatus Saccharibacteria bacterium]
MIIARVSGGTNWHRTIEPLSDGPFSFQLKVVEMIRARAATHLECELDPQLTPEDITVLWESRGPWSQSPFWLLVDIAVQRHHGRNTQIAAEEIREALDLLVDVALGRDEFLSAPGPVAVRIYDGLSAESSTPLRVMQSRRKARILPDWHDRGWSSCRH